MHEGKYRRAIPQEPAYGLGNINRCRARTSESIRLDEIERNVVSLENHLAFVLEIDGDAIADQRLDLAKAPVRALGMAHQGADFQKGVCHAWVSSAEGGTWPAGAGMREHDLAGIVAARICHDLVSPVGAIENGLDLIAEIGPADCAEEIGIVRQSAERAAAQLRLLRLAFGRVTAEGEAVARPELRKRIEAVIGGPRVAFDWRGIDGPALPAPEAALVALLALVGRAVLGIGGNLQIQLGAGGRPMSLTAEAPSAGLSADQMRWLDGDLTALPEPRHVEFPVLARAAGDLSTRVSVRCEPGKVLIGFLES